MLSAVWRSSVLLRNFARSSRRPSASLSSVSRRRCPSCSRPLPSALPACTSCWYIAPLPRNTLYHDVFGLSHEPNPFVIDAAALKNTFLQAQAICHPDTWASRGSDKQEVAQGLSSLVNEAYQRLSKPLSRAEYILELHGRHVLEHDQLDDMEFMAEIMDARETVDEATNPSEIEVLQDENDAKISEAVKQLELLIRKRDWGRAKSVAIRLRYLEGIRTAAKNWLDNH